MSESTRYQKESPDESFKSSPLYTQLSGEGLLRLMENLISENCLSGGEEYLYTALTGKEEAVLNALRRLNRNLLSLTETEKTPANKIKIKKEAGAIIRALIEE